MLVEEERDPKGMFKETTDDALLEAVQRQQQEAIEELYDRYGRIAFSLAYRIVNDYGVAEDVVQDAFLRVWRQAGSFTSGRGTVKNWLLSIVHHRAIDVLRSRGDRPRRDLPLDSAEFVPANADVWREVSRSLERDTVRSALATLPDAQRETIELAYFGGYTYVEISDLMDVPLGTVKSRMRLGLEHMRTFLEAQSEEIPG
jgi:RNA polymerase sigma-70 factor, ECF subfamily